MSFVDLVAPFKRPEIVQNNESKAVLPRCNAERSANRTFSGGVDCRVVAVSDTAYFFYSYSSSLKFK